MNLRLHLTDIQPHCNILRLLLAYECLNPANKKENSTIVLCFLLNHNNDFSRFGIGTIQGINIKFTISTLRIVKYNKVARNGYF
jgi:hypothetical protein